MFNDVSCLYLLPGEVHFSKTPVMVNTVLGSCISVTMFCKEAQTGMICHAMLPNSEDVFKKDENRMKYMDCAVLHMHQTFADIGIKPSQIEVKIFGGSDMFAHTGKSETVGQKNIVSATKCLADLKYKIIAKDIGGQFTRKLYFSTETGIVYVRKISRLQGI